MSALDDLWREIMGRDLEAESTIAAAYGIGDDELPEITFKHFHYSSKYGYPLSQAGRLKPNVRAAFKALCADEISVPVFDVTPGTRLSRFFAVEPHLAP